MKKRQNNSASALQVVVSIALIVVSIPLLASSFISGYGASSESSMPLAPAGAGWSIVTSANTSADQNNYLRGMTCTSASDCWAVAYYHRAASNHDQTLIERWNGTSWSIVASPNTATNENNYLYSVSCTSMSDCWAVGFYISASTNRYQTLIERWNGTSWSIVASPNSSASENNSLSGVTCTSGSDCWAIGGYHSTAANYDQTLIERWNGTSWSIVASPNSSANENNSLTGVTCTSGSDCWTVGSYQSASTSRYQTLIERWNGTSWSIVNSPNGSANENNSLWGVTCTSGSDCWTVGYYGLGSAQTLTARWNGTSWSIVDSPNTGGNNYLMSITCNSGSDCWAAGYYQNGSAAPAQTLMEYWNGTFWSVGDSPNTNGNDNNYLYGVMCTSTSDCWAAGYYLSASTGHWQTLIVKYSTLIVQGAVSRKIHGSAGSFDIDLALTGTPGIECRTSGGTNDYTMVVMFGNNVSVTGNPQAQVIVGTGCVGSSGTCSGNVSVSGNAVTVPLTNIANAQTINVRINGVNSAGVDAPASDFTIPMSILIGDTNANGSVDAADVAQTKSRIGQPVGETSFRSDVNANGTLNAADAAIIKANLGTGLP
jgi:hypothetical protein